MFVPGDPRINRDGRPPIDRSKKLTKREVKNQELLSILRRIKPHLSDSIMTAAKIMKSETAMDANKLKAAVILLNAYKEIVTDVYDNDEDQDEPSKQEDQTPVFSLKIVE